MTLHREKGNPDYVVEAGALVLSDRVRFLSNALAVSLRNDDSEAGCMLY